MVGVRGRGVDIVNNGRLGPKGLFGSWQGMDSPDRLTRPLVRRDGVLVETDWDTAMGEIVDRSRDLLAEHGPLSHGFYTSGTAVPRGVLRAGRPRQGRSRHPPHGRQHPAVYRDGGRGDEGELRFATASRAATRTSTSATRSFSSATTWPRRRRCCGRACWTGWPGPNPPRMVCVDPRDTEVARDADVHLPVAARHQPGVDERPGPRVVRPWLDRHRLRRTRTPSASTSCARRRGRVDAGRGGRGLRASPAADVRRAAELFGTSERVLSTVLQGFYQSNQATAAACQVNNLHLLRGMLGRPGCGVLQMNGQPTAQNTRECGADGDLPGFRNWENPAHVDELAGLWNVDPLVIPHWAPPTHAMQIFRYAEQGSIKLLWVSGTNPAVSMPELAADPADPRQDRLFLVVQDLYLTETARVRRRGAAGRGLGREDGHLHQRRPDRPPVRQAVDPPGEARSDLDIFLDYARRMDFRDRDGDTAVAVDRSGGGVRRLAGVHARAAVRLHRPRLRAAARRQRHPVALQRRPTRTALTGCTPTDSSPPTADDCEDFGHDLLTGANVSPTEYRAMAAGGSRDPEGRPTTIRRPKSRTRTIRCCYTTGRTAYHFHTRTKTARAPVLNRAAPRRGSRCLRADADPLGSARETSSKYVPGVGASCFRSGSVTSDQAPSSRRSTTATSTILPTPTTVHRTPPTN